MTPRFALPTFLCPAPLRVAVGRVKDAGADAVRLDLRSELKPADLGPTAVREVRHLIRSAGLAVGPAVYPTRGAVHDEDRLDARLRGLTAAVGSAGKLGCSTLTLRPFDVPGEDEETTRLVEVLTDLAAAGAKAGVVPCVTVAGDAGGWARVLDEVTTGPVGVTLDPAAVLLGGGDPGEVAGIVRVLPDRVREVTVRDATAGRGGREVPAGQGDVDWEELLAVLDEAAFPGSLTPDRTAGPDPFAEAAAAITALRDLVR